MNAAPSNLGGTPTLNHFLVGNGLWGFLGGKGFFLSGPAYDAGSNVLTLFEVVFMETAGYIIVGAICERITFWSFILCELFIGAATTKIYCRPICPIPFARPNSLVWFASAAAAEAAGYRPCGRCRPEASPGTPAWLGTSAIVSRALRSQG